MASRAAQQSVSILAAISGLSGSPTLVAYRKTDVLAPKRDSSTGDPDFAAILTGGERQQNGRAMGDGSGESLGWDYYWQITIYDRFDPTQIAEDDGHPLFVERCIKALSTKTLAGCPEVWDYEVTPYGTWGIASNREGVEANRFGLMYRTWEPTDA